MLSSNRTRFGVRGAPSGRGWAKDDWRFPWPWTWPFWGRAVGAGEADEGREEAGEGPGERRRCGLGAGEGSASESEWLGSSRSCWDSLIVTLSRRGFGFANIKEARQQWNAGMLDPCITAKPVPVLVCQASALRGRGGEARYLTSILFASDGELLLRSRLHVFYTASSPLPSQVEYLAIQKIRPCVNHMTFPTLGNIPCE